MKRKLAPIILLWVGLNALWQKRGDLRGVNDMLYDFFDEPEMIYEKKRIAAVHDMGAIAKLHICGNIDPVRIIKDGTPELIKEAVRNCLDAGDETSFISSGCEIPVGTPHENLLAVSQVLSEYGRV